jgi:hypothetical protein
MTDLSPAAQAVAWAYDNAPERPTSNHRYHWIAAALRAAADQGKEIEVPFSNIDQWEKIKGSTLSYWTAAQWGYQNAMSELLAIADELEAQ